MMKRCKACGEIMQPFHSKHYDGTGEYHEGCRFGEPPPAQDPKQLVKRTWFFLKHEAQAIVPRTLDADRE